MATAACVRLVCHSLGINLRPNGFGEFGEFGNLVAAHQVSKMPDQMRWPLDTWSAEADDVAVVDQVLSTAGDSRGLAER